MVGRTSHIFARVNLSVPTVHPRLAPAPRIKMSALALVGQVSTPYQDQGPSLRQTNTELASPVIISMGSTLRDMNDILNDSVYSQLILCIITSTAQKMNDILPSFHVTCSHQLPAFAICWKCSNKITKIFDPRN